MNRNIAPASDLIGELVHSSDGQVTGQIEEILVDTENAQITYALISFDRSQNMTEDWIAFPWRGVRMDLSQGGDGFILGATGAELKSAPSFSRTDWPNFADPQFEKQLLQHFDLQSKWTHSSSEQNADLQ